MLSTGNGVGKLKMNGANALIQSLVDNGVNMVFGLPGGVMLPIYDALYGRSDCAIC